MYLHRFSCIIVLSDFCVLLEKEAQGRLHRLWEWPAKAGKSVLRLLYRDKIHFDIIHTQEG